MDKVSYQGRTLPDPRWSDPCARRQERPRPFRLRRPRIGAGRASSAWTAGSTCCGPEAVRRGDTTRAISNSASCGTTGRRRDRMKLDVRSAILRKGTGSITATAVVRHGGVLRAQALASGVPIRGPRRARQVGQKVRRDDLRRGADRRAARRDERPRRRRGVPRARGGEDAGSVAFRRGDRAEAGRRAEARRLGDRGLRGRGRRSS
jgi:hypothetical protein